MNDPLEIPLRDIHLPDSVAYWPLAYAWWLLIFTIIAVFVLAVFLYLRSQKKKLSAITLARHEYSRISSDYQQHSDAVKLTTQISILLRRLSISLFPRTQVASLTGDEWLRFLDDQVSGHPFTNGKGRVLIDAPYRENISSEAAEELMDNCGMWIDSISVKEGLGT
jgi:hypothetical protein